jgi:hypothetical protein
VVLLEEEQSGQLPFLDVMVKRQDNQLNFDVYRKTANSKIRSIPNLKRTLLSIQWRIDYAISIYLKKSS